MTKTALEVATEELQKAGYSGNKWEKKFNLGNVIQAVLEEEGIEGENRFRENNKIGSLTRMETIQTKNGNRYLATYSNSKIAGVASGKKRAKFVVNETLLVDLSKRIIQFLQDHPDECEREQLKWEHELVSF